MECVFYRGSSLNGSVEALGQLHRNLIWYGRGRGNNGSDTVRQERVDLGSCAAPVEEHEMKPFDAAEELRERACADRVSMAVSRLEQQGPRIGMSSEMQ
jgi:hypothetical protein